MSKLTEIRLANVRALIEQRGGVSKLARALGYQNASFISQMTGPEPTREITERTARRIEEVLKLPSGSLDQPQGPQQVKPDATTALVADVIRIVGAACEAEGLAAVPSKFSELVIVALNDSLEHGGTPRPEHVRSLVRLVK